MSDPILTEFSAITHRVATIGEHVIEFVEGGSSIQFNGVEITATELEHVARAVYQAAVALGVLAAPAA